MHKRKIAALTMAAIISNFSVRTVGVLAHELGDNKLVPNISDQNNQDIQSNQAKVSKFNLLNSSYLEEYNKFFKLDNSKINSITNNGGNYESSVISKAIDGDFSTHWETGNFNSSSFENEVILTLDEVTSLNRIVYGARQDSAKGKGFAQEFEIYSSLTDDGDDFTLVSHGKYSGSTSDIVEIKFNEEKFKRIKFKFKKANQDWASASEFMFYREDSLSDVISNMFTDGTMSELKDEYNNIDVINNLEKEVNNHPLKDELIHDIDLAKEVLQGDKDYSDRIFTLTQYGNTHAKAKNNLQMSTFGTDLQSTGIIAKPGEEFTIYVESEEGSPLPSIAFTQHEGFYSNWIRQYQLKQGKNVITVPEIYSDSWSNKTVKGGAVYLVNKYTKEQQAKAPVVRIEGGETFPLYNLGDDKEAFIKELKEYNEKLEKDPENTVDVFEFNSTRLLYTGTASAAYKVYVEEGVDIGESVDNLNGQIQDAFEFSGLKDDETDPTNDSTNVRTTIRLMQPYGLAYAYVDHIGIQRGYEQSMLRTDRDSLNSVLWATVHEAGHQMDISAREWPEVTNNIWANSAHIKNGMGDRVSYSDLYKYLAPEDSLKGFDDFDYFQKLGMFWQLQLKKDTYWAELETLYRERKPRPRNEQEKKDILATYSSEVLGINLTYYFEKYGFTLSDKCKESLKQLPESKDKIWYLNSTVMDYEGSGFDGIDTGLDVSLLKLTSGTKLSMSINENTKDDLLGYEILRNGKVIAFTTRSTYIDKDSTDDNSEYEVVPYAKDLTIGNKVQINSLKPSISIQQEKVTLKRGEKFNPKDYVKGFTYLGEDITSKLKVESNVNTDKNGAYQVKYTLTNEEVTVEKSLKVEVVSDYDYLSDFKWTSVNTEWGTPRRNSNIQGMVHGEVTTFKNGIGIHANGKITYDLSDKEYDNFEALIGVDTAIGENNNSSVTFKVVADGKTVATTNIMSYYDNLAYINIPVSGVKELVIEVHDGGNGNTSDHCIIVNPKLTTSNGKPKFKGDESVAFNINEEIDLIKGISVTDGEDGDLTSKIEVESDYIKGNTGIFNVTCSVKDSDGNKAQFTRTVVVTDKETYLSDLNWKSATIGSGYIGKDKSVRQEPIKLLNEDGYVEVFKKGIGTHAYSEIVYDSTGYDIFDAWVGLDQFVAGQQASSVIFKVYVDGVLKAETPIMKSNTPKQHLIVDVRNSSEIKLVVDVADSGDTWDHADWADAKFRNFSEFDLSKLEEVLEEARALDLGNYTEESAKNIKNAIENGEKTLSSNNQTKIDTAVEEIRKAINSAVEIDLSQIIQIKDKNLKLSIQQELGLQGEVRLGDMRELVSLTVKNVQSLEGLQYAVNLESLNIENNKIKDLSPLKDLKNLTNLKAHPQIITEDWVLAKDKKVTVDYDVLNRNGEKLTLTSIIIKDNRTWDLTTLNVEECVDENGKISFDTTDFYSGIHTVYMTYEDKVDNYITQITFVLDTRER